MERSFDSLLQELNERAKELNCLYKVDEILKSYDVELDEVLQQIVSSITIGWQYPQITVAKIEYNNKVFKTPDFVETNWFLSVDLLVQGKKVGVVKVYYTEPKPEMDEGPFLKEERRLINAIGERLSNFIFHYKLKNVFSGMHLTDEDNANRDKWKIALDLLKETDANLYYLIARKMLNYLCWSGISEAEKLLHESHHELRKLGEVTSGQDNIPLTKEDLPELDSRVFKIATDYLTDDEILFRIQKWMQEEKTGYLVRTLENFGAELPEITDAIRRFLMSTQGTTELTDSIKLGLNVSLIRRFLSDQLQFISIAKNFVEIKDFYELLQKMIYPNKSHGKIGGKSVGVFIAKKIIECNEENRELFHDIKVPKTWYITTDTVIEFMHYNNLEEVIEQKYKDIDQIRQEYPFIIQVFKNSKFPPEIVKQLSVALDDFGDHPLIVRSSSLLEDRMGAAFSGKYKSLFVANQGTKEKRLSALIDAIAEVYASVFSPDAIEYRAAKDLLDFNEQMGIMIQEVVGTRVGKYFLPSYAGVAFSNNEFRWSPRIRREDGLVRIVAGLGTRAVDRVSDDYPILLSPGKPGLRVNVTVDEVIRYSPQKIDVINLESCVFETIMINDLFRMYGNEYPNITQVVSRVEHDHIKKVIEFDMDTEKDDYVVTFDRLTESTNFLKRMQAILSVLKEKLQTPVDIEFASVKGLFYLLQCRPQSYNTESMPAPIPRDLPTARILFNAKKYISNGKVPDITHIVYVDPEKYNDIPDLADLKAIGRAIGKLNKMLPKRQFILMGPGRWGSRGDIKLGVNVTYADINNTAVLIEVAKKKGNYQPELSFGTHFFQDLVEAQIRYLPLYPDDPGIIFKEAFFRNSNNILPELLPEFENLRDVIKVIDIPKSSNGMILRVLMNADIDEAIAILSPSSAANIDDVQESTPGEIKTEDFWRWRLRMAEKIAQEIDPKRFGVKAMYIFGSTKNATAGPGSDIDLLFIFNGSVVQKESLRLWLDGWSKCLAEMNFLRTGYKSDGLLDIHIITDEDIKNKNSYAMKINAITDPAKELVMRRSMPL